MRPGSSVGGFVVLTVLLAGSVAAQDVPSLRIAMLYGTETGASLISVIPNEREESPILRSSLTLDKEISPRCARRNDRTLIGFNPAPSHPLTLSDTTLVDPWFGRDKVLHAAGSFLLTLSAQYVLTAKLNTDENTAIPIAAGTAFSFGLAKEVADSQRPVRPLFSTRDLVADAVGVALAVGLILL